VRSPSATSDSEALNDIPRYARHVNPAQDTPPEIQARMDEAYRRMSAQEKFERAMGLSAMLRALTLDHLRALHPNESERQLQIRLLLRTVPASVVQHAFGWLPPDARVEQDAELEVLLARAESEALRAGSGRDGGPKT
jgi:hypothetical protein